MLEVLLGIGCSLLLLLSVTWQEWESCGGGECWSGDWWLERLEEIVVQVWSLLIASLLQSGNCSAENAAGTSLLGPPCPPAGGREPVRVSSPEFNAAKSEFLLTAIASRLAPGLCTAGEAGLAAWGGRTFSEHPGAIGQHLWVLFSEVGLLEYLSQSRGGHKSSLICLAWRRGFHLQTSLPCKVFFFFEVCERLV